MSQSSLLGCSQAWADSGITALLSHGLGTAQGKVWPFVDFMEPERWLLGLSINSALGAGELSSAFSWLPINVLSRPSGM